MAFKKKESRRTKAAPSTAPEFHHASGYTDLAGVLGDHTLNAAQEAAAAAPKGYRYRSITKEGPPHRH